MWYSGLCNILSSPFLHSDMMGDDDAVFRKKMCGRIGEMSFPMWKYPILYKKCCVALFPSISSHPVLSSCVSLILFCCSFPKVSTKMTCEDSGFASELFC